MKDVQVGKAFACFATESKGLFVQFQFLQCCDFAKVRLVIGGIESNGASAVVDGEMSITNTVATKVGRCTIRVQ